MDIGPATLKQAQENEGEERIVPDIISASGLHVIVSGESSNVEHGYASLHFLCCLVFPISYYEESSPCMVLLPTPSGHGAKYSKRPKKALERLLGVLIKKAANEKSDD